MTFFHALYANRLENRKMFAFNILFQFIIKVILKAYNSNPKSKFRVLLSTTALSVCYAN